MRLNNCIVVVVRCSVKGGVSYQISEEETRQEGAAEHSEWKTEKTISDVEERKAALNTAQRIRRSFGRLGVPLDIGIVIPMARMSDYEEQHAANRKEVDGFNATSTYSRLSYVALPIIVGTSEEAARYVMESIRDALQVLRDSLTDGDVQRAKDALRELKGVDQILRREFSEQAAEAVKEAQSQVRAMGKRLKERQESTPGIKKLGPDETRAKAADRIAAAVFAIEGEPPEEIEIETPALDRLRGSVAEQEEQDDGE